MVLRPLATIDHALQIEAMDEGAKMSRRRDGDLPAVQISLPDNNDMLQEILLRLPPWPSSLPRASAVCKRWRRLVTDPKFIRQFRVHHQKPPLLSFFEHSNQGVVFTSLLDPPDRIPHVRFSLGRFSSGRNCYVLDCRHGHVLVKDYVSGDVVVCDSVTGEQLRVAAHPELKISYFNGALLFAAGNQGHLHGHSSPFNVVLVSKYREDNQPLACVYSSETDEWGNLISTESPCDINDFGTPATVVGNVVYWLFNNDHILEFDLDRQNLAMTVGPSTFTNDFLDGDCQIMQAEDGVVGFSILTHSHLQMWQRNVNCQNVATWVPWKTIEMHNILGLSLQIGGEIRWLLGYDEDNDVIFVYASRSVYAVQLKSMQCKKLYETNCINGFHHFTSFYTLGTAINGGSNGAEMLHDT